MNVPKLLNDCRNAGRVYIAGHKNPDGDAVGACFALALAMRGVGVEPVVLLDAYSEKFSFLAGNEFVYAGGPESLAPEVLICLDCASDERLGHACFILERAKVSYNIDHHGGNTLYADYNIVDAGKASSSEMVYGLIKDLEVPLTKDIAAALYTGIIGDTGAFRHSSCTPETHIITAELLRTGFDFSRVQRLTIYEHSLTETKIFAEAIRGLTIVPKLNFAYSCLGMAQLNAAGAKGIDLDGIPEYLLNTRGVETSALLSEREDGVVYISLRSVRINVRSVAERFGGGGHMNAAGFRMRAGMDAALEALSGGIKEEFEKSE
jgi:phosphoesterase RecJ-like protein